MSVATDLAAKYGVKAAWNLSDLADAFGANTLVNNGGATFGAGKLGNAVNLALASSQSLSIADNAALSGIVGGALWIAAWVKFATLPATNQVIAGKVLATGNQREYRLILTGATQRFGFGASGSGSAITNVAAATFGAPTTGVWYFVMGAYDPVTELVYVSVNGGAFDTTALAGGVFNGTGPFVIGAQGTLSSDLLDGQVDAVAVGKPPLGWITGLMDEIRDFLFNANVGREYPTGWEIPAVAGTAVGALSEVYSAIATVEAIGSATATLEAVGSAVATVQYDNP